MPRIEEISFPYAYLFTDVKNHELFIDWATNVRDDCSLLLALLERVVSDTEAKNHFEGEEQTTRLQANKTKDPIRVAHAYAQIKRLEDHDFNIFESAFFEEFQSRMSGEQTRRGYAALVQATLVVFMQLFFTYVIASEVAGSFRPFEMGDKFHLVVPISILSTFAFFFAVMTHGFKSRNFNQIVAELACFDKSNVATTSARLGASQRFVRYMDFSFTAASQRWCLFLNSVSNELIGALLVVLNIPFVLLAENPTEAILNALATGFIIEIDDLVRRIYFNSKQSEIDWDNERAKDLMIGLATRYVKNPNLTYDFQEILVEKSSPITSRMDAEPYSNGEECHIYVVVDSKDKKYEFVRTVSVLIRHKDSDSYDHIKYVVSGPGMQIFIDDISEFNCYRPWKLRAEFLETFGETPEILDGSQNGGMGERHASQGL